MSVQPSALPVVSYVLNAAELVSQYQALWNQEQPKGTWWNKFWCGFRNVDVIQTRECQAVSRLSEIFSALRYSRTTEQEASEAFKQVLHQFAYTTRFQQTVDTPYRRAARRVLSERIVIEQRLLRKEEAACLCLGVGIN